MPTPPPCCCSTRRSRCSAREPPEPVRDLIATVHLKTLLLGWAYDRTYGFMDRLFNGPLQLREHRRRLARNGSGAGAA